MTHLVFHHDHTQLPPASDSLLPVQLYCLSGKSRGDIRTIGSPIVKKIKQLNTQIPAQVIDFLSITLAVTAADTFVLRRDAANGWARQLSIKLPLTEPDVWKQLKGRLEKAFQFLSGDMWEFEFVDGGYPPPKKYQNSFQYLKLTDLDCACLFSGGLDSSIGAINLLAEGRNPLLVSHAYRGDNTHQKKIASVLSSEMHCPRLALHSYPLSANRETDTSMRTRSCSFLAFGALGACVVQMISQQEYVDLFVPENGSISLNAPLTSRRIGSLSTRTTHPYFIKLVQEIFETANIPCTIRNPYQFKTKGEMIAECQDHQLLEKIINHTVSCSRWKRNNKQCGICVPCLIRRAALHAGGIKERTEYLFNNVADVLKETDRKDDLLALCIAIDQKSTRNFTRAILDSGPLTTGQFQDYKKVSSRNLEEIKTYLEAIKVL